MAPSSAPQLEDVDDGGGATSVVGADHLAVAAMRGMGALDDSVDEDDEHYTGAPFVVVSLPLRLIRAYFGLIASRRYRQQQQLLQLPHSIPAVVERNKVAVVEDHLDLARHWIHTVAHIAVVVVAAAVVGTVAAAVVEIVQHPRSPLMRRPLYDTHLGEVVLVVVWIVTDSDDRLVSRTVHKDSDMKPVVVAAVFVAAGPDIVSLAEIAVVVA